MSDDESTTDIAAARERVIEQARAWTKPISEGITVNLAAAVAELDALEAE